MLSLWRQRCTRLLCRQSQRGREQENESSPGVLPSRTHESSHKTPTIEKGDADTNGHEPGVYSLVFPDGKESQRVCRIRPITSGLPPGSWGDESIQAVIRTLEFSQFR